MSDKINFKIWAFSNENLSPLADKVNFSEAEICGVSGTADPAFSFLSLGAKSYQGFETREKALFFVELKKAMVKELSREAFERAFRDKVSGKGILKKVEPKLSKKGNNFWQQYLDEKEGLRSSLKKSGLFYNYSFKNFRKRNQFFSYLKNEKNYQKLRGNLQSFQTELGSIQEKLQNYEKEFDFIYLSNILDSPFQNKTYLGSFQPLLNRASKALRKEGKIISFTLKKNQLLKRLESKGADFEVLFEPSFVDQVFFTLGGSYPYSVILIEP